jgi:hypothetical protein
VDWYAYFKAMVLGYGLFLSDDLEYFYHQPLRYAMRRSTLQLWVTILQQISGEIHPLSSFEEAQNYKVGDDIFIPADILWALPLFNSEMFNYLVEYIRDIPRCYLLLPTHRFHQFHHLPIRIDGPTPYLMLLLMRFLAI